DHPSALLGRGGKRGTSTVSHRKVPTMTTSATHRQRAAGSGQQAVKTFLLGCLLPAACCLLSPAPARADDALRKELAIIAKGIAEAVKGLGHDAVAVGEFTGPAQLAASGGPVIVKTLTEELPKLGLAVKRAAQIGIKG